MNKNKMNKLFLILGIGIGLLVASFLNIAYPRTKYISYTDTQIIEKARELGMVPLKEAISKKQVSNEGKKEVIEEIVEDSKDLEKEADLAEENNHIVEFVINKGDNSEQIINKLFDEGIISDKDEFTKTIIERNLQKKFKYGVFELEIEMEHDSLIKILTSR